MLSLVDTPLNNAIRRQKPSFKPTGLHLKCEGGAQSNPVGPLYYTDGDLYAPVFTDARLPDAFVAGKFLAAWLSLRKAEQIAKAENLPLEVFQP